MIDKLNLYRILQYTDMAMPEIRVLVPVDVNEKLDETRTIRFISQCQVNTGKQIATINFEIPAKTLEQAIDGFQEAADKAAFTLTQQMAAKDARSLILQ